MRSTTLDESPQETHHWVVMKPKAQELAADGNKPQKAPKRIAIGPGDHQILKLIYDYRLLRIVQVEALIGRHYKRLHDRFKGMFDHGFLGRIERPWQKDIYYLKRPGLAVLQREGFISDEEADRQVREGEIKSSDYIEHELMISDFHILVTLATRSLPLELVAWKEGTVIRDSFEVWEKGERQKIEIEPDAFFTLRETISPEGRRATRNFLVEADRSSMSKAIRPGSRRFNDKIRKYEHYIREDRPRQNSLNVPQAYILALTLNKRRRDSLAQGAAETLTEQKFRKFFLFGSRDDLSFENPATLFHPVFKWPGDAEATRLLLPWLAEIKLSA